jgi:hypothetical protein
MYFVLTTERQRVLARKFMRIVQQVTNSAKVTYDEIKWDIDPISEYFAT